ncbi:hypothetical protein A8F94_01115 [Bacillus sp. FJAT-27225]|uniref:hypothetical protein n=1 Tax=Bacillus sp. FJAT-27225 TaxID=1743144 RepID=UPI00080C2B0B|nr:hypothetical protein [Bacillus sp. FJAT-27225]OCA90516.1 hypothetical protein A8F94_01115 [Bacillus sp. FJAT-27225]
MDQKPLFFFMELSVAATMLMTMVMAMAAAMLVTMMIAMTGPFMAFTVIVIYFNPINGIKRDDSKFILFILFFDFYKIGSYKEYFSFDFTTASGNADFHTAIEELVKPECHAPMKPSKLNSEMSAA